jgi:hypothetical protein
MSIRLAHASEESFPDAALANMEMDVTLRIILRELLVRANDAPGERRHWRGVATAPGRGGRAVVYRRTPKVSSDADSASVATRPAEL